MKSSERGEDIFELLNSDGQQKFLPLLSGTQISEDKYYLNFESPLYQVPISGRNIIGWCEGVKFPSFYQEELSHYLKSKPSFRGQIKIVLVANNKYRGKIDWRLPVNIAALKGIFKNEKWQRELKPNFKARDIVINECSKYFDLDIYGKDWFLLLGNKANYCGTVQSKYEVMLNYNASICYENIDVDHYVTEKVPQAIMLGQLPIVTDFQKKYFDLVDPKLTCTWQEFIEDPKLALKEFSKSRETFKTKKFLQEFTYEAVVEKIRKVVNERYN